MPVVRVFPRRTCTGVLRFVVLVLLCGSILALSMVASGNGQKGELVAIWEISEDGKVIENGLAVVGSETMPPESRYNIVDIAGVWAAETAEWQGGAGWMAFPMTFSEDVTARLSEAKTIRFEIEYYDQLIMQISVMYKTERGAPWQWSPTVTGKGGFSWKVATFTISHAIFDDVDDMGAQIRLQSKFDGFVIRKISVFIEE